MVRIGWCLWCWLVCGCAVCFRLRVYDLLFAGLVVWFVGCFLLGCCLLIFVVGFGLLACCVCFLACVVVGD